jgi:nitric oxide reductase NorQ protein
MDIITPNEQKIEEYAVDKEPYYLPIRNEVQVFAVAFAKKLPLLLKGPTGCGKTRFVEYMAWKLGQSLTKVSKDEDGKTLSIDHKDYRTRKGFLVTVPCHEDLTANDLAGRYYISMTGGSLWVDGPLAKAARYGGICYLDEVIEARKDVAVLIHPLTDYRRTLPLTKKGTVVSALDSFMLVVSFNPGYQSVIKDMKQSTRQRFIGLEFDYPPPDKEVKIVMAESGLDRERTELLVKAAVKIRKLKNQGLSEGASTRLLTYAGHLMTSGIKDKDAIEAAIISPLTDDEDMKGSILDIFRSLGVE